MKSLVKTVLRGIWSGFYIAMPLLFLLALVMFWDQHRQLSRDKIEAEETVAGLQLENIQLKKRVSELERTVNASQTPAPARD